MSKKKTIEEELELVFNIFDSQTLVLFLREVEQLIELYDVDETDDWVESCNSKDDVNIVRLIRTSYILSRISSFLSGKFLLMDFHCHDLYKKLDKQKIVEQKKQYALS